MEIIKYLLWCGYAVVSRKDIELSIQDMFVGWGVIGVCFIIFLIIFGMINEALNTTDSCLCRAFLSILQTLLALSVSFILLVLV